MEKKLYHAFWYHQRNMTNWEVTTWIHFRSWGEYLAEQDFSHWALGKVKEAVTWTHVDDSLIIFPAAKKASNESCVWSRWWLEKIVKVDLLKQNFSRLGSSTCFFSKHSPPSEFVETSFGGVNNNTNHTHTHRNFAWINPQHFGFEVLGVTHTAQNGATLRIVSWMDVWPWKEGSYRLLDIMGDPSRKNTSRCIPPNGKFRKINVNSNGAGTRAGDFWPFRMYRHVIIWGGIAGAVKGGKPMVVGGDAAFSVSVGWRWSKSTGKLSDRKLGGGFKHFLSSPQNLGKMNPILTSIFFRWVGSTTNQKPMGGCPPVCDIQQVTASITNKPLVVVVQFIFSSSRPKRLFFFEALNRTPNIARSCNI